MRPFGSCRRDVEGRALVEEPLWNCETKGHAGARILRVVSKNEHWSTGASREGHDEHARERQEKGDDGLE